MLALIPSAVLLLAALAIFIVQRLRPSVGYSWLIAMLATLLGTGWTVYLRWHLPQQTPVSNWLPFSQFTDSPILGLDGSSWPYMFALASLSLAVILTASARLDPLASPTAWMGVLSLSAAGILAVLSANLLTLILAWSLLDLIELVILQANSSDRSLGVQTVIGFSARVTGTVLVMVASIYNSSQQLPPTFASLPTASALLLLLACGLRLGVLPLHLGSIQGSVLRRGLGTTLRMVSAASALVVLARLPARSVPEPLAAPLLALTALASLYSAAAWASSQNELEDRPYWMIALGGFAIGCVIEGRAGASLAWGMALILSGSVLFLYSARRRQVMWIPLLALLGMSGLALTPTASGWTGLLAGSPSFSKALFLPAQALLIVGFIRSILRTGDDLAHMERWIQAIYPVGLAVLVLAQLFTGLIGWPGSLSAGVWWATPFSLLIAGAGWLAVILWRRRTGGSDAISRWYAITARRTGAFLAAFFNLSWLYRALWWIYRRLLQMIEVVTRILEGDGGVLWALVLLALFVSLIQSGLSP